jgi:hypothetical protein
MFGVVEIIGAVIAFLLLIGGLLWRAFRRGVARERADNTSKARKSYVDTRKRMDDGIADGSVDERLRKLAGKTRPNQR